MPTEDQNTKLAELQQRVEAVERNHENMHELARWRDKGVFLECVEFGNFDLVKRLIQVGANADEDDDNQDTALMYAIRGWQAGDTEREKIVTELLIAGAEPNVTNMQQQTAAMLAAKKNATEILKMLLIAGATNLEAKNALDAKSVLSYAAANNCEKIILEWQQKQEEKTAVRVGSKSFLARAWAIITLPFRALGRLVVNIFAVTAQFIYSKVFNRRRKEQQTDTFDDDEPAKIIPATITSDPDEVKQNNYNVAAERKNKFLIALNLWDSADSGAPPSSPKHVNNNKPEQ